MKKELFKQKQIRILRKLLTLEQNFFEFNKEPTDKTEEYIENN